MQEPILREADKKPPQAARANALGHERVWAMELHREGEELGCKK